MLSVIQASQVARDTTRLASKKVTLREKERIAGAMLKAGALEPSAVPALDLNEATSFLERFEAEQKTRRKMHNDRAALRRKEIVAQPRRSA